MMYMFKKYIVKFVYIDLHPVVEIQSKLFLMCTGHVPMPAQDPKLPGYVSRPDI